MIDYPLQKIKALIFDVDGVLSSATIPLGDDGQPRRTVNIKDGYALQLAVKRGMHIAIITGAKVENIRVRYNGLGIKDIFLGQSTKIGTYRKWLEDNNVSDDEAMYMGDDIPDLEIMSQCGLPACPADAAKEIKAVSRYISPLNGGMGCARDIIEQILTAQGKWVMDSEAFGW